MRGTGYAVLLWRIRKRARPSATARAAWTGFTTGTPSFASRADLLKDIQQESGVAYLFITHDLAVVRWISHRIEVMRSGRIVESGPTARICAEPREEYTKALLAAAPVPDPRAMRQRRPDRADLLAAHEPVG